jgi:putative Holliday junction resolvase
MRVMSLDIGEVRCGIAISDPLGRIASPVKMLPTAEILARARTWRMLLEDYEPDLLLSGLPLSLDGGEGPQALRIRTVAQQVAAAAALPIEFVDERLSSSEAKRILHEQGLTERSMRGKVDMIAASLFLQAWLDGQVHRS